MRRINISGQRFGRLIATAFAGTNSNRNALFYCLCDCGKTTIARSIDLRNRHTNSCGCYMQDQTSIANTTHGHTVGGRSDEYKTWIAMRRRCNDPSTDNYKYYGGRGIKLCKEWENFDAFYKDMGPKPTNLHSIERRNVNGNYQKDNCYWATKIEQMNNTTRTIRSSI